MLPRLATFCRRMTSIGGASMLVRVRQQGEEACALDRNGELALIERLRTRDAARNDLARLGDVALDRREILVIDVLHALGGEAAELLAAGEAATTAAAGVTLSHGHDLSFLCAVFAVTVCRWVAGSPAGQALSPTGPSSSSDEGGASSRERSRRRPPPSPPSSSSARAIGEGSVTASSMLTTRWRNTASLNRKAPVNSP